MLRLKLTVCLFLDDRREVYVQKKADFSINCDVITTSSNDDGNSTVVWFKDTQPLTLVVRFATAQFLTPARPRPLSCPTRSYGNRLVVVREWVSQFSSSLHSVYGK